MYITTQINHNMFYYGDINLTCRLFDDITANSRSKQLAFIGGTRTFMYPQATL